MDGAAIVLTFATCSGPDCLKSVISKFGVRVKVYTAIKAKLESDVAGRVSFIIWACWHVVMNWA